MQNRSLFSRILDEKRFPSDFRASGEKYIQQYREDNVLHYHNCLEIGLCMSGSGLEYIGNKVWQFFQGSITFVQKDCIHDAQILMENASEKPSEWSFIFVDLDAFDIVPEFKESFIVSNSGLTELFWMMFDELENTDRNYQDIFTMLLKCFIAKLSRIVPRSTDEISQLPEIIMPAITFISKNYNRDISIADIAASCNLSESHFRKLFHQNFNCGPLEYLNDLRLSATDRMLKTTDMQISQISEMCGFSSLSSFNRLFKRRFGISPREARNREQHE